jgi:transposase
LEPELKQMQSNLPDSDRTLRRTAKKRSGQGVQLLYTLTLWTRLSRILKYAQLELSNNLAENAMRPIAPGGHNWIHIGSEQAGPRVAAIVSVVETCRRLKIPIREYLCSILPGLANFPINRVAELTPACWRARA